MEKIMLNNSISKLDNALSRLNSIVNKIEFYRHLYEKFPHNPSMFFKRVQKEHGKCLYMFLHSVEDFDMEDFVSRLLSCEDSICEKVMMILVVKTEAHISTERDYTQKSLAFLDRLGSVLCKRLDDNIKPLQKKKYSKIYPFT